MEQMIVLWLLAVVVFLAFVAYPRIMFAAIGAFVRGFVSLLADAVALLLAWV